MSHHPVAAQERAGRGNERKDLPEKEKEKGPQAPVVSFNEDLIQRQQAEGQQRKAALRPANPDGKGITPMSESPKRDNPRRNKRWEFWQNKGRKGAGKGKQKGRGKAQSWPSQLNQPDLRREVQLT